jgi:hypothetical protein
MKSGPALLRHPGVVALFFVANKAVVVYGAG